MSHKHLVEFYETDASLIDSVASFAAPALDSEDAVIIVATEAHRNGFDSALEQAGVDIDAARRSGRYITFDAAETLAKFMVDGRPSPELFQAGVGALITAVRRVSPVVRIYGEMVAILWEEGQQGAAIELEDLWNDLAGIHEFELLCAYPIRLFDISKRSSPFWKVCNQHTSSRLTLVSSDAETDRVNEVRSELGDVKSVIQRALRQRMIADEMLSAVEATEPGMVYQLRAPNRPGASSSAR